jgi:serine/threonine-protein kinase
VKEGLVRELREGDHLDQYLLTDVLARTAGATIFKGHDTEVGAPVCVKVPNLEHESEVVFHTRLTREEDLGLRLDHHNVVRTLKPLTKSRLYVVTEYVEGKSLRTLMRSGPLPEGVALDLICQILEALVYLHRQGVVHRDIKPENVMVTAAGEAKVIDLGIALDRSASRLTWTNLSRGLGTPDYMAPEQMAGRRGDERSDVYAAGLILYEMLTGELPFEAERGCSVTQSKLHDEPRPLAYHLPSVDPAIDAIVSRATARDARQRPRSAAEMLDRLRRRDASNPGDAPSIRERRPWLARAMLTVALAGLGSLIWLSRPSPRAAADGTPNAGAQVAGAGAGLK